MKDDERVPTPDEARLLERVLTGELDEDAPEVRSLLARAPGLAARLAELRRVASALEAAARDERETLAEAGRIAAAPGHDRVREALRRAREAAPAERAEPRRAARALRILVPLSAAAVLVLAGRALLVAPTERERPAQTALGGAPLELVAPVGRVEDFGAFAWRSRLPADATYHLRIESASPGGDPEWSHSAGPLTASEWRPPDELDLPDRVRWEVEARDSAGGHLGSASATAWR